MGLSKLRTTEIAAQFGKNPQDTGSTAVQIALLTERINTLAPHFGKHIHDHNSKRGLMKMIGSRRKLLKYLARTEEKTYQDILVKLNLRK